MSNASAVVVADRDGRQATFAARPGERLLHAGLAAGVNLPHECATGTCGSCKATLDSGEVAGLWAEAPGRRFCRGPRDILMCQSAARGDVALSLKTRFDDTPWPSCGTITARLVNRREIGPEIMTFDLALEGKVTHEAGQFVLLSAPGIAGPRAYSMSSHDPEGRSLSFLVRRKAGGTFTEALFAGALDGCGIEGFGPLGRAVLTATDDRPFVAIAGGSGIAGLLSILQRAQGSGYWRRHGGHLFFGLRDSASAYLLDELADHVAGSEGALRVTVATSDAPADGALIHRYPRLSFATGFVHEVAREAVAAEAFDMVSPLFFVAGPPPMVDAAMRMLVVERKVNPRDVRYDRFG